MYIIPCDIGLGRDLTLMPQSGKVLFLVDCVYNYLVFTIFVIAYKFVTVQHFGKTAVAVVIKRTDYTRNGYEIVP